VVVRGPVPIGADVDAMVRRACFASAAEALATFRVHPDEILTHLTQAGLAVASRPERVLQHLDGVAHAVACVRGDAAAWTDLANHHGWCLERAAMDQFGIEGALAARRFWTDARRGTLGAPDDRVRDDGWPLPRLQWYAGLRPLRHWLADRLFGGIEARHVSSQRAESSQRERLDTLSNGRSLASPAVNAATAT